MPKGKTHPDDDDSGVADSLVEAIGLAVGIGGSVGGTGGGEGAEPAVIEAGCRGQGARGSRELSSRRTIGARRLGPYLRCWWRDDMSRKLK